MITGLNRWAIGIELINLGPLTKKNGKFYSVYNQLVDSSQVTQDSKGGYWQAYTDAQIKTVKEITPVLIEKYKCLDVLGHEEISPGRKIDPGPANQQVKLLICLLINCYSKTFQLMLLKMC